MAGQVVVDSRTFKRGVDALKKQYGHTSADVMRRQMSIVSGQLAKRYPPNKQAVGKQAISNDLSRLFVPVPQEDYEDLREWQEDYKGTRDVFDYEGESIQSWHKQHMNPSKNRVTRSVKGNWQGYGRRFSNKMHVRDQDLKKYINKLANNVGQLKAGWYQTRWVGGAKLPKWVTKHGAKAVTIDRMKSNGSGYLEIRNHVEGSARWKRIDKFVMNSRQRGFIKELKHAVRKADKAGNAVR